MDTLKISPKLFNDFIAFIHSIINFFSNLLQMLLINSSSLISKRHRFTLVSKDLDISLFKKDDPWTHFVIDDFLQADKLKIIQSQIFSKNNTFTILDGDIQQIQYSLLDNKELLRTFLSKEFKSFLEKILGVKLAINESVLIQLRKMDSSSPEFPIHHDKVDINRSLVVIYYLSPNWKNAYGGELCLYKDNLELELPTKIIEPIENRIVFFFSDENNWHSIKKVKNWERYTILSEWFVIS